MVFLLFLFGTIVGSFLNVVGLRWDTKKFGGRSHCPSCKKKLSWWELVPVLSFFLLKAKCSGCKNKISFQYPLVEIWTGLVFSSLFYTLGFTINYLLSTIIFCIYIVITIYDLKHKIIPDELVYTAIVLSLLSALLNFRTFELLNLAAGPIIFLFFASIWFFSRGRAMGFGDAKLGLGVGLLLGAAQGFSAIILAFWIGAVAALGFILLNKFDFIKGDKELTMKSEVPFAPAIILGAWIALLFHLNIIHVPFF